MSWTSKSLSVFFLYSHSFCPGILEAVIINHTTEPQPFDFHTGSKGRSFCLEIYHADFDSLEFSVLRRKKNIVESFENDVGKNTEVFFYRFPVIMFRIL